MSFAHPLYLLLFLILPILVFLYITKLKNRFPSFQVASTEAFKNKKATIRVRLRHLPFVLRLITLGLIIIVIARPQSMHTSENVKSKGIDIIMALDFSGSMLAMDFTPDRLTAEKKFAAEFINNRPSDNIGLVVFAGESFTQCPLTTDHKTLVSLLNEMQFGMIEDGTAIGDGIATSTNRLKDIKSNSRVIILMTDGSSNKGQISPLTAAEIAKSYGIKIYTIGIGSEGVVEVPVDTPFGVRTESVEMGFDEKTLIKIASITGGQYFWAKDNRQMQEVLKKIDQLEKRQITVKQFTQKKELYRIFALLALLTFVVEFVLRKTIFRTLP